MKVIDDGVIKYNRSNFTQCGPINLVEYSQLEVWRKKLFHLNLIGEYPDEKIGFGHMSEVCDYAQFFKTTRPQFIITGTQTGKYENLDGNFYTRVLDYDIQKLNIQVMGPVEASSEALTHAAIYSHNHKIKAVFHIHSTKIWEGMINDELASTQKNIPYGTVEMAYATQECIGNTDSGIFCMKGHQDGVVAYGESLEEVGKIILESYQRYLS